MDTSLVVLLVRVVVSLGVVLAVMAGAAAVLRRSGVVGTTGPGKRGLRRRHMPIEVIARHGLSRGSSIAVVRLGERALVLGVTEHQISLLKEVDPAELAGFPGDAPGPPGPPDSESIIAGPASPGTGPGAIPWKVALEQLRERTVRRS